MRPQTCKGRAHLVDATERSFYYDLCIGEL